jgi:hypothetical protein
MRMQVLLGGGCICLTTALVSLLYNKLEASAVAPGWDMVSAQTASSTYGAVGFMQSCSGALTACPPRAGSSPGIDVTCLTIVTRIIRESGTLIFYDCATQQFEDKPLQGCSAGGTFKDCSWARCLWCGYSNTSSCGTYERVWCNVAANGACDGTARVDGSTTGCRWDCK